MKSHHHIVYRDSGRMAQIADASVDLIVTSPPYPMIEMWDDAFSRQNGKIGEALANRDGPLAFELMHRRLDPVWDEAHRVLKPGGIACINIGDATRTIGGRFALYPNHSRIHGYAQKAGFSALPAVLWRKQTNAPNKFMGSGMMPPGAYVTLEHEYVLVLRKGDRRAFRTESEKRLRRRSAFFWEERNVWFSDVWTDLKGTGQQLFDAATRKRSAAFPFELPYRLICMFSIKEDTVLDPFAGVGTTMAAAMAAGRNSIGYEIDRHLQPLVGARLSGIVAASNDRIARRLDNHLDFVRARFRQGGQLRHRNRHYRFPVVTKQESELLINGVESVRQTDEGAFEAIYSDEPQPRYVGAWEETAAAVPETPAAAAPSGKRKPGRRQRKLFP